MLRQETRLPVPLKLHSNELVQPPIQSLRQSRRLFRLLEARPAGTTEKWTAIPPSSAKRLLIFLGMGKKGLKSKDRDLRAHVEPSDLDFRFFKARETVVLAPKGSPGGKLPNYSEKTKNEALRVLQALPLEPLQHEMWVFKAKLSQLGYVIVHKTGGGNWRRLGSDTSMGKWTRVHELMAFWVFGEVEIRINDNVDLTTVVDKLVAGSPPDDYNPLGERPSGDSSAIIEVLVEQLERESCTSARHVAGNYEVVVRRVPRPRFVSLRANDIVTKLNEDDIVKHLVKDAVEPAELTRWHLVRDLLGPVDPDSDDWSRVSEHLSRLDNAIKEVMAHKHHLVPASRYGKRAPVAEINAKSKVLTFKVKQ